MLSLLLKELVTMVSFEFAEKPNSLADQMPCLLLLLSGI